MRRRELVCSIEVFASFLGLSAAVVLTGVELHPRDGRVSILVTDPAQPPLPEGEYPLPEPLTDRPEPVAALVDDVDLVDAAHAARLLGMPKTFVQRHSRTFPFYRKIGSRARYSKKGIARWLESRRK